MDDTDLHEPIMTLKADNLHGPKPTKGKLKKIVIEHIKYIEQKIKEADSENKTAIEYNIVSDFDIPGMNNDDIQTFVYSKIIEDLSICGYEIAFRNEIDNYTFFITWRSKIAKLELDKRKKILNIASKKFKDYKNMIINKKSGLHKKNNKNNDDDILSMNKLNLSSSDIISAGQSSMLNSSQSQQQSRRVRWANPSEQSPRAGHRITQTGSGRDDQNLSVDDILASIDDEDLENTPWSSILDSS